jgi:L-lactate dehydrogenase complex protein LldF
MTSFQEGARIGLRDAQLRANLGHATRTIREKRSRVVAEVPDWEALRTAGAASKDAVLRNLDRYLLELEGRVQDRGGVVHWARDAAEANRIAGDLVAETGADEVVKVKSLTTEEIGLNEALAARGIAAVETDLAALIVQLGDDAPSHILVPAIHKNRAQIRELFLRTLGISELSDDPAALAEAARVYLRERFLRARVGISGANFAVASTGTVCVVESEGNGRMCTTLPETLITIMGIEKVVPALADLEVFLQLLPRSSTAERMNPYTSLWTGVHEGDGPRAFHLILLDNGRTNALADDVGRETLRCIRCSACLNVCPVYARAGGHAYGSVYPGPIGAIITPQLVGIDKAGSLPYASTLCGACADVCPVRIDIPRVLIHLRGKERAQSGPSAEKLSMQLLARIFASRERFERLQRAARRGRALPGLARLPGPLRAWGSVRELPAVPEETFRDWWRRERSG